MSNIIGLNRRAFIKGASMTALAGAVGTGNPVAAAADARPGKARNGKYNFDEIYSRVGTGCIKWDRQIERFGADHIEVGMGIADMDFRAAPCITEALAERCKHENWGYLSDTNSYVEAIAAWNSERHGIEVDPGSITVADGVHPGLIATLTAVSPPGTKVLMNTPTYNGFYGDLRWTRTLVNDSEMYLDSDGVYHIDWDDFEARMTPDCHAMLLCNPQNPTGNMWSEEDLLRIGELCLKHGVTVLADEIHCDFVMKGQKYTPFASLPDKAIVNNSLTFKAVSKTFSLAAMKSAYFFSTNPVLLERVRWHHRPNTNTLGVVANEAAYRNGAEWFDQLLPYIDENHSFVEAYIKERIPLIKYKKAQGTYLAWLDVTDLAAAIDAEKNAAKEQLETPEYYVEKWVVENARVHLQPGSWHGAGGANHMRMNLGAPRPLLEKALDNIAEAAKNV